MVTSARALRHGTRQAAARDCQGMASITEDRAAILERFALAALVEVAVLLLRHYLRNHPIT